MTAVTVEYAVSFGASHPIQHKRGLSRVGEPVSRVSPKSTKPLTPRVARLLALAHYVDRAVEAGHLKDYASAARILSMTRARMAQVMALLSLSPSIQERILTEELQLSEPAFRSITKLLLWNEQENALNED